MAAMAEQHPGQSSASSSGSPPAQRLARNRWSDPRLVVGVVLLAVAVVAGATIIEASDDTTVVWALRVNTHAGAVPELAELERVDVHLEEPVADQYVSGTEQAVAERLEASVWAHDVAAGELLALSALGARDKTKAGELPLRVAAGSMPADLQPGQWVDVWVGPGRSSGGDRSAAGRVLERVRVQGVRARSAALGNGSAHVVLIALDESTVDHLGTVLARVGRGAVTLVRVSAAEAS